MTCPNASLKNGDAHGRFAQPFLSFSNGAIEPTHLMPCISYTTTSQC